MAFPGRDKLAVILLSGGLDSMVAAGLAQEQGFRLAALTIDYGQRHRRELESARAIAAMLGTERHQILSLDLSTFGGSALTSDTPVPKEGVGADIPVTYVPARNIVFLSLTLAWAEALDARDIFIGVNALDYSGYPDCRPVFITQFEVMANMGTKAGAEGERFQSHAPLQHMRKSQIAAEALRLQLDPAKSWSCYDPQADGRPCGLCDSCRLRREGFAQIGHADPLDYATNL